MADSNVPIKDAAAATRNIDTRSVPGGDERQVLALGDGENAGVLTYSDQAVTGNLTASGQAATAALRPGDATCSVDVSGTFTATATFEFSFDGGTSWRTLPMVRADGTGGGVAGGTTTSSTWETALPAGTTHVRARCSAFTSGTIAVRVATSVSSYGASNSMLGTVRAVGLWFDDTATALAASATFTGTARDLTNSGSGTLFSSGSQQGTSEARLLSVSDVVGDLCLEVSRDGSTWRRIRQVTASNVGTGGLYVAEINHSPKTRFARLVYVNGAGAQGHFMAQTFLMNA